MEISTINMGRSHDSEGGHRKHTFMRILQTLDAPSEKSLLDLGSGPCIFPKIARDLGFSVTAVDARTERVPTDLGSIRFVESDVRKFQWERFNVVSILGLLFHLEVNEQVKLLANASRYADVVIIDTQVHIEALVCTPEPERFSRKRDLPSGYSGIFLGLSESRNAYFYRKSGV